MLTARRSEGWLPWGVEVDCQEGWRLTGMRGVILTARRDLGWSPGGVKVDGQEEWRLTARKGGGWLPGRVEVDCLEGWRLTAIRGVRLTARRDGGWLPGMVGGVCGWVSVLKQVLILYNYGGRDNFVWLVWNIMTHVAKQRWCIKIFFFKPGVAWHVG